MNSTFRRIAAAAPVAAVIFGFGISAAQAMPINPNDPTSTHQVPDFGDVIVVDTGPADPGPQADPVDPPASDPGSDPSDDTSDDSDHDSDHHDNDESDNSDRSNSGSNARPVITTVSTPTAAPKGESASSDEASDVIAPVYEGTRTGVQVPLAVIFGLGAAVAGVVAWAGLRRQRMFS